MYPYKGIISELLWGKKDLTDRQIEATIFDKLARKGMWGNVYRPAESMAKWITNRLRRNGKRVESIMHGLEKKGLLLFKKSGMVVSLNPRKKEDILKTIEDELY
ncbi:MAG: hypothetical protein ISS93_02115 [Candidatus Aenigmarchaeota archaeon]|nr:hypothetical protein [Candidatus Aenigmarchaeota archaeon]